MKCNVRCPTRDSHNIFVFLDLHQRPVRSDWINTALIRRRLPTLQNNKKSTWFPNSLERLEQLENTWQTTFYPDKCEMLCVTNKSRPKHNLHGIKLQNIKWAKYLGLNIASDLYDSNKLVFLINSCPSSIKAQSYKTIVGSVYARIFRYNVGSIIENTNLHNLDGPKVCSTILEALGQEAACQTTRRSSSDKPWRKKARKKPLK